MGQITEKQRVGKLGEDISCKYLENIGFSIVGRNYLKKCGEIDIIAKKKGVIHFVEVKSVSCEKDCSAESDVSRETDTYRPEDNIHPAKLMRLARVIEVYLLEKFSDAEPEWQFDAITVKIDLISKQAKVKFIEDIIL